MVDENQTPPPAQPDVNQAVQNVESSVQQAEKSISDVIKAWLKQLYERNKFIFYTVIPIIGLVLLVIKFREVIISFLVADSKEQLAAAKKQDQSLADEANRTKAQADKLVDEANSLPGQEQPVDENWNKK